MVKFIRRSTNALCSSCGMIIDQGGEMADPDMMDCMDFTNLSGGLMGGVMPSSSNKLLRQCEFRDLMKDERCQTFGEISFDQANPFSAKRCELVPRIDLSKIKE